MDGSTNLRTAFMACCLALTCCTAASAGQSVFEKGERDFYRRRANDSHYLFLSTLEFFAKQRTYEAAVAKSAEISSRKERWILIEKLAPELGYFQIAVICKMRSDAPWKAYTVGSDKPRLTEVDVRAMATRIDKLWGGVPTKDVISDALSTNDPVIYYISVGRKSEVKRRLAVVNPGFKKTTPEAGAKIQLDMPVDDAYLQLSSYTMELMSIIDSR